MKADLYKKISKITFYIAMAVSAIIIALFFFVGFGDFETINNNDMRSPQFTDALLYWIYVLTALAIVLVLFFAVVSFAKQMKESPLKALKSLAGVLLIVVLFVVSYFLASDTPIYVNGKPLAINGAPVDPSLYIMTDVLIYVQYILLAACVIVTVFAMLNISGKIKK